MKQKTHIPGQICRWNPVVGFERGGIPCYVVGTNYVARYVCTNFWEDWRPQTIARDLDLIASTGLNAVRIPIHWEYAEPSPGQFREEALERISQFLDMAMERGLLVMPWFLVGVATLNYDVSWRNGRSFFSEPMVSHAENHLRTMVGKFRHFPNILCWDICDEPEWYSEHPGAEKLPYNCSRFQQWVDRMYKAVREVDPERAVTLAFGHIATGNYGMDVRRAAAALDVMAVTAYPPHRNEDLVHGFRSGYFLGWSVRFNDCAGKGVFTCEAPGWNDVEASEESVAALYRVALMSNLANGSLGVMPWVWNDFDDAVQCLPPLDRRPQEKRFGIVRENGTLKPAGRELSEFADFVASFHPHEWKQESPEVHVLVPVLSGPGAYDEFDDMFHQYIFLRQAGLRVRYLWAEDLSALRGDVLFLPNSKSLPLTTGDWLKLQRWVEKGGTLVCSNQRPSTVFNALFGVTREGLRTAHDDVRFRGCREGFGVCEGIVLPRGNAFVELTLNRAELLCSSTEGSPLVTCNRFGDGRAIFIAYAPETSLARIESEQLARHPIHRFYRAIAELVGLTAAVSCGDPRIELDIRRHSDGRLIAILINHSRFPAKTSILNQNNETVGEVDMPGCGTHWVLLD